MKTPSNRSFRPNLESLEDRTLMTTTLFGGTITIEGTPSADVVKVSLEPRSILQKGGIKLSLMQLVVRENGVVTGRFNPSQVNLIEFYGFAGNDTFKNQTAIRSYAEGGIGNDTLVGGAVTDEFYGGGDNDIIKGMGGLDYLFGQDGRDRLDGGRDGFADELYGGRHADTFISEAMGVSIIGGQNRDAPLDFNAFEGDRVESGLNLIQA